MSIQSNIGVESCAKEVLSYVEWLMEQPEYKEQAATRALSYVRSKLLLIKKAAEEGWY